MDHIYGNLLVQWGLPPWLRPGGLVGLVVCIWWWSGSCSSSLFCKSPVWLKTPSLVLVHGGVLVACNWTFSPLNTKIRSSPACSRGKIGSVTSEDHDFRKIPSKALGPVKYGRKMLTLPESANLLDLTLQLC